jgi:phospholipid-binding lipoprotein MlaA
MPGAPAPAAVAPAVAPPPPTATATAPGTAAESEAERKRLAELGQEYAEEAAPVPDPAQGWNMFWFNFNNGLHLHVMRPVALGYRVVLYPRPVRIGVRNFLENLGFPGRTLNSLLQGKGGAAGAELGRFVINLTVGVLGFGDPATHLFHMQKHYEDFDQTLGVWGMEPTIYLTWPFFGPSSVRGTLGALGEGVLNPIVTTSIVRAINWINEISLDPDSYKNYLETSVDPYTGVKNAYLQNREVEIRK